MSMSQSRFDQIFTGQSSIAKKVYEAIPIAESWSVRNVMAELARQGTNQDQRTVMGCIDGLKRAGLVNELVRGEFRREGIKAEPAKTITMKAVKAEIPVPQIVVPMDIVAPMDILGSLAARAVALGDMAKQLADDIGDAAIEIQQQIETSDADTKKFRQLQALLKGIA